MFIVASGNCSKVMTTPDTVDTFLTLSTGESSSKPEFLGSNDARELPRKDVYRNGEMYRLHEVSGENLVLGDGPAEDYVVLGSVE